MLASNSMFVFPQAIEMSLSLSGTEIRNSRLQCGITREQSLKEFIHFLLTYLEVEM